MMSRATPRPGAIRTAILLAAVTLPAVGSIPAVAAGASGSVHPAGGSAAPEQAPEAAAQQPQGAVSGVPTPVGMVAARGGAVMLRTRAAGIVGQSLSLAGTAPARYAGGEVTLERRMPGSERWVAVAHGRLRADGSFTVSWLPSVAGLVSVRVVLGPGPVGETGAQQAHAQSSGPAEVRIYRAGVATYFGPGLYGERTACGQVLTPYLVGVANRTLPCGTLVAISYGSETLVVPVVDRGPYRQGVDWDLTYRAARVLGAEGMEQIGTMIVGSTANTPLLGDVPGLAQGSPTGGSEAPAPA